MQAPPRPLPARERQRWSATVPPVRVLLTGSAVLGFLGTTYLVLAGTSLAFKPTAPDLWFYPNAGRLSPEHLGVPEAAVLTFLALGALVAGWLLAGLAVWRGASFRAALLTGLCWTVPLLVGPPLFSADVFHYAAIGASVVHGVDPFVHGPGVLGDSPAIRGAEEFWRNSPSPYSPPFVQLAGLVSRLFSEDLVPVVVGLRVVAVAAWAGLISLVRPLARYTGTDPRWALWLGLLNPLVLLHGLSAAHNDLLMAALLGAGLLLALRGHPLWGVVCCALAGGVKVVALVAIPVLALEAARRQTGRLRQLRALLVTGLAGLGVFALGVQLSGWGWTWVHNISVPDAGISILSPTTVLAVLFHAAPVDVRPDVLVVAAVACLLLLTRVWSWGPARVTGWMLLAAVGVGLAFWPWYLIGPVVLLGLAGVREERWFVVLASVAALYATLPSGAPTPALWPVGVGDHAVPVIYGIVVGVPLAARAVRAVRERRAARERPAGRLRAPVRV